jgi:RNA polymerase sigma factor (sigma-70 family)
MRGSSTVMTERSVVGSKIPAGVASTHASFEDFFESEHRTLFRRMCLITNNPSEAEELMQDAFMSLWERWDRVAAMLDPTGYLYRTAMNLFRKRYRHAIVAARRSFRPEPQADAIALVEARTAVSEALASLSPRQRAAVVLTDLIGFSSEEAASMLGVRPGTIRSLTSQGRSAIRGSQIAEGSR